MSTVTFPGDGTLVSSANTPDTTVTFFQQIVAQQLGFDPVGSPATAFKAVRVAWQQAGQPTYTVTDDVCILRATADDNEFSRARDNLYQPRNSTSVTAAMGFTQTWTVHFVFYGPNAYDHARQVVSAMSLDLFVQQIEAANFYPVPDWRRPQYTKELFQGQWWPRADLDLKFNEEVLESITVSTAASVEVIIVKENGYTSNITV
jgi:hypothetical protein